MKKQVEFSRREQLVLDAVRGGGGKKMSTKELADLIFGDQERPFYARQSIVSTLSTIAKKARVRKEKFVLRTSERKGPQPIDVWIEEDVR